MPDELLDRAQWVGWQKQTRGGDETKVPLDVTGGYASATDAATWTTFDEALAYATDGPADGVGYVFSDDDPIVGVDLDKCRNSETGATEAWAQEIIDRLDSYTEVSPSGTGYHILVQGSLLPDGNRTGNLELYEHARFFTMTGDRVDDTPPKVAERTAALAEIHSAYFETPTDAEPPRATQSHTERTQAEPPNETSERGNDLTDDDVIRRASNAANSVKFRRLWGGDTSAYDSRSDADMALCSLLAFWTAGDATQMDRLFRDSGLYRERWDEVHFADGSTYGEKTIERAVSGTSEFYDPTGFSSAVRRSTTRTDLSRRAERDRREKTDSGTAPRETTTPQDGPTDDHLDRLDELQEHLESVLEENERLEAELERERERRRELEAQLEDVADDADDGGWSLFGWFR